MRDQCCRGVLFAISHGFCRTCAQAIELLSRASDITPRERDLLKAIPEMEVINAMVGNVKLAMPGLSKIKTEARRSRKKGG